MVSQLSLRLLGGSSCATSAVNSSNGSKSVTRSANASTHGYSADNEEIANKSDSSNKQVPSKIDMITGSSKKRIAHPSQPDSSTGKKQKIMARNYAAHTVKQDLSRGDLPYPKVSDSPRLFLGMVDTSLVSLVPALDVDNSPFLVPAEYTSPFETDYWNTMMTSLVTSSSGAYKKTCSSAAAVTSTSDASVQLNNEDAYSSASSISDSEEGESSAAAISRDEKGATANSSKDKSTLVNMGNALAISNQARLVVLGFAPYSVVHANAAYSRMTGIPSTTALGQPLHEIFLDEVVTSALQSGNGSFSLTSLHLQSVKMNSSKDMPTCVVRVSPVGSDAESVTHFVLELETRNAGFNNAAMARQFAGTIEVMG